MYLLDNNVISEMRKIKTGKANHGVVEWLSDKPFDSLFTCEIVIMELYRGILLKQRKDPLQAKHLHDWLDNFVLRHFKGRILNIDRQTSLTCASFHVPNPRADNDAWIASIAHAHNLILVTRNIKDFTGLPIELINPFSLN